MNEKVGLTPSNFKKGFLIDDELMGGISEDPAISGTYVAFVIAHETGEYVDWTPFTHLDNALGYINNIQRPWTFESLSPCKNEGNCHAEGGGCGNHGDAGKCESATEKGCTPIECPRA